MDMGELTVKYDSTAETLRHIRLVNALLKECCMELLNRAVIHDNSKLETPEKELFDEYTPKLADVIYGSDEYQQHLKDLKPALDNHYANNTHHPEHYQNGINDMDLFDVMEMLMDWKASTTRNKDGDILKSLQINKSRFNISDQLYSILYNTIKNMNI
jgi:hypothetical protein